jgi:hypothetical protein
MSKLKKWLGVLVAFGLLLVAIVFVKSLFLSSSIVLTESVSISAPVSQVKAVVDDFSAWNAWTTWSLTGTEKVFKPASEMQFSPAKWSGEKIGSGEIKWISQNPLQYQISYSGRNNTLNGEFDFVAQSENLTVLSWKVSTELSLSDKLFWTIANVKNSFEKEMKVSLARIEKIASKSSGLN